MKRASTSKKTSRASASLSEPSKSVADASSGSATTIERLAGSRSKPRRRLGSRQGSLTGSPRCKSPKRCPAKSLQQRRNNTFSVTPEEQFAELLKEASVAEWTAQHKFHPTRKWRFDFAWPDLKVACEIDGGIFSRGRHVNPRGFIADCEKSNAATQLGWRLFRFPVVGGKAQMIENVNLISQIINEEQQCRS